MPAGTLADPLIFCDESSDGSTAQGEISGADEWWEVELEASTTYTIQLNGIGLDDPYMELRDSGQNIIGSNDDTNGLDSEMSVTPTTTSTYYVGSLSVYGDGTYEINITPDPTCSIPYVDLVFNSNLYEELNTQLNLEHQHNNQNSTYDLNVNSNQYEELNTQLNASNNLTQTIYNDVLFNNNQYQELSADLNVNNNQYQDLNTELNIRSDQLHSRPYAGHSYTIYADGTQIGTVAPSGNVDLSTLSDGTYDISITGKRDYWISDIVDKFAVTISGGTATQHLPAVDNLRAVWSINGQKIYWSWGSSVTASGFNLYFGASGMSASGTPDKIIKYNNRSYYYQYSGSETHVKVGAYNSSETGPYTELELPSVGAAPSAVDDVRGDEDDT